MTGRRPLKLSFRSPWLAAATAASLVLGLAGVVSTTAQAQPQAEPAPAAAVEPPMPPRAPDGSVVRIRLNAAFQDDLGRSGAVIVGIGQTRVGDGGTLEIPIDARLSDGFGLAGGFALMVGGDTTYNCPDISIYMSGNAASGNAAAGSALFCGVDGATKRLLDLGAAGKVSKDGRWVTRSNIPLSIADDRRAAQLNAGLKREPFAAGDVIGEMDVMSKYLLKSDYDRDPRAGCEIGNWAGDNSIWRATAIQSLINRLPKDVGISQYSFGDAASKGSVVGGDSPAVTVGQRTPYMEKVTTNAAKRIIRGSQFESDNFYDGYAYGCNSNAPFIVGQGLLDAPDVKAWRYDGGLRTTQNNPAGSARPQWWGHARQTDYDGPTGNYSWTCRGTPENRTSTNSQRSGDTWWSLVRSGSGFFGDSSSDNLNPDAGRAPVCRDLNMDGFTLTTRYSLSKRGGLEARNDQVTYPRSCSVSDNPLVSCWQEIYPLFDRAWAFQNHVYASAMRANVTSNATINIPASWSASGIATVKPIAWRISDGSIGGAWPNFLDGQGNAVDLSGIETKYSRQDMSKVSPFTVPGTNTPFTVSGYGSPMGQQEMTFILTADTDGSWTWPVDKNGRELPRPQIKMTYNYVISNYDDGGTCRDKIWYDDDALAGGRNNDAAGGHCLQGDVPTLWPLPENKGDRWKRVPDTYITDKDGKRVRNTPNVTFEYTSLTSCLNDKELTVQDNSTKTNVPNVGADFTWDIRLSGQVKSFSGC